MVFLAVLYHPQVGPVQSVRNKIVHELSLFCKFVTKLGGNKKPREEN